MVSRTTAHSRNPGEKANLSTEEFQSIKKGMIYYIHEATLEMSKYPAINYYNSMSKYIEQVVESCRSMLEREKKVES